MQKGFKKILLSLVVMLAAFSIFGIKGYAAEAKYATTLNGVDYSAVYDYDYYTTHNPDIKQAYGGNDAAVLNHFVTYGMAEGRQASANFDVSSYRKGNPDVRAAYGNDLKSYYMHYINYGRAEGRKATGVTELVGGVTRLNGVNYSAVYDYKYYTNQNSDVKQKYGDDDIAVLNHFVTYGMTGGRQAIETFDVKSYKLANPDVRAAYGNDLKSYYMHYINYGRAEGRKATGVTELVGSVTRLNGVDYSAVYDYKYYTNQNSDVKQKFGNDDIAVLNHFVTCGMTGGRQAIETFDVKSYKLANPDLRAAYGNDLKSYYMHYINYGKSQGRTAIGVTERVNITMVGGVDYSAVYDYKYYITQNPDVKQTYGDDDIATLNHFVTYGMAEGRLSSADFNVSLYKGNYWDLQDAFGSNLKNYYSHYLDYGKSEGRTGKSQIHNFTSSVAVEGLKIYTCSICGETHRIGLKQGIDVSVWQDVIDWQKVKDNGIQFAMIRVGIGSDQTDQDDTQAIRNMSECERLGIPYGVYLYSYALSNDEARSEASHMLRMIKGRNPSLGVYLDVEDTAYYNKHGFDPYVNKASINNFCSIFLSTLQNQGYSAGIYSDYDYYTNIIDPTKFSNYRLWLANWGVSKCPNGNWHIWQYTSDGTVPGINGRVDMDILIN